MLKHMLTSVPSGTVAALADRLASAAASRVPCAPVRDVIAADDTATAYAVQQAWADRRLAAGARVVGRKIGLTSPVVQQQLGVDRPDFGILFSGTGFATHDDVPIDALLQPKVEAEVAFVLRSDVPDGPFDAEHIRDAVDYAVPALEIVDSRIANWDITFVDTVADNGSSAGYVLGSDRLPLDAFDPAAVQMRMYAGDTEVSSGDGAACMGSPLAALAWLAETVAAFGRPLRAGEIVLSGALGPMYALAPDDEIRAEIDGLGVVSARFTGSPTTARTAAGTR